MRTIGFLVAGIMLALWVMLDGPTEAFPVGFTLFWLVVIWAVLWATVRVIRSAWGK